MFRLKSVDKIESINNYSSKTLKCSKGVQMKTSKTFLPVFFFVISLFSISLFPYPSLAVENDVSVVQKEANKGGYQLIDVESLSQLYQTDRANLVLIDTRQEWEYHAGYIQGAVNFPMEPTWLSRLTNRGALEQFLGSDKNKTFVFY